MTDIFSQLAAPFDAKDVHWRAQTLAGDGKSAMALAYMDARDVMRRLDAVVGPAGWQDTYSETAKGRMICSISIKVGSEWITKSDGAGDTDVEGEKGGISDAFKRAAVKWGIGRYLYDVPVVWAECEVNERGGKRYWKKWTPRGVQQLNAAAGKFIAHEQASDAPPNVVIDFLAALEARQGDEARSFYSEQFKNLPDNWKAYAKNAAAQLMKKAA